MYVDQTGPVIYKSKTLLEDATPEIVRDFFWDDEFRPKWDPMLAYFKMVEECPNTGTTIVHWIKKVIEVLLLLNTPISSITNTSRVINF